MSDVLSVVFEDLQKQQKQRQERIHNYEQRFCEYDDAKLKDKIVSAQSSFDEKIAAQNILRSRGTSDN